MIFDQTITIVRAAVTRDRYNQQVRDWNNATHTDVSGVSVQPAAQTEDVTSDAREMVTTGWRLQTRSGDLDLDADDRIEWAGRSLEVVGEIARWPHPLRAGHVHHVEAFLEKRSG